MKDKKKIVIGTLCALIMIMAVGYALLSQQLSINGTANITSTWKIEITNITEKERHGGVTEKSKSYDSLTANFNVGFTSPGDYIIYEVEVTNSGTLDAVIERVNVVTNDNPAIIYTTSGIKRGTTIESNTKKYLTVKIEYDSSVTSQPQTNNNALTVQLFTEQNLGQVQPEYDTYSIGDKTTFAGSDWYVVKDSSTNEDYVTLIKENVLTSSELGSYAFSNGRDTARYSLLTVSDYGSSTIKKAVDNYMNNYLDESKLKIINEYKIRIMSTDELTNNLGCTTATCSSSPNANWIYNSNIGHYWLMETNGQYAFFITTVGGISIDYQDGNGHSFSYGSHVRPVINLLKSAIE